MEPVEIFDHQFEEDQRGTRWLVKRSEQNELHPVFEPLAAEDPLLPRSEPVVAGDHSQPE